MSTVSSAKVNYTSSEVSLTSSVLMTATSTYYTYSDADYETSSELLTPRVVSADSQISQHCSVTEPDYAVTSKSSTALHDGNSSNTTRCFMSIKSDSCLSQQGKMIDEFMNDVLRMSHGSTEPNVLLGHDESLESVMSEFRSIENDPELVSSRIDDTPCELQGSSSEQNANIVLDATGLEKSKVSAVLLENVDIVENEDSFSTMSETKNKILENLAQVTYNKLFSKSNTGCHDIRNTYSSSTSSSSSSSSSSSLLITKKNENDRPSKRSILSEKSLKLSRQSTPTRNNGIESILMIDYELQPLNLMLSRLLAEFKAMDGRGKFGFIDTNCYSYRDKSYFRPEIQSHRSTKSFATVGDKESGNSIILNEYMKHSKPTPSKERKVKRGSTSQGCLPCRVVGTDGKSQASRSCETNCWVASGWRSRLKLSEKCERCSGHQKTNHFAEVSKHSNRLENEYVVPSAEKADDSSCRIFFDERKSAKELDKTVEETNENESGKSYSANETIEKSNVFSGLFSLVENCAFLTQPLQSGKKDTDLLLKSSDDKNIKVLNLSRDDCKSNEKLLLSYCDKPEDAECKFDHTATEVQR